MNDKKQPIDANGGDDDEDDYDDDDWWTENLNWDKKP